jgi:rhodanese-related sulfurtransferase
MEESEILVIDSEMLDIMLTWDQTGSYEVAELQASFQDTTDDWMTALLQTTIFSRIPPANIQAIFMRMQRVSFRAGELVIQQGSDGDYFYAIVSGKCQVTRETPLNRAGLRLAELTVGDTFGEEALIAEAKRNATVTMLTDGTLMRLDKADFRELMAEPMQQWRDYQQCCGLIAKGARWLDVRLPSEYQNVAIPGALNLPLYFIRMKLNTLDKKLPYIVYCDTGRRSSAAAFILQEHGFDAFTLRGGINGAEAELRRPG